MTQEICFLSYVENTRNHNHVAVKSCKVFITLMCETYFVLLLRVKTVPTLEPMFICTYMLPNPKHHLNWPRSSIEGLLSNEVFIKHVNTTKQVK